MCKGVNVGTPWSNPEHTGAAEEYAYAWCLILADSGIGDSSNVGIPLVAQGTQKQRGTCTETDFTLPAGTRRHLMWELTRTVPGGPESPRIPGEETWGLRCSKSRSYLECTHDQYWLTTFPSPLKNS